MVSGWGIQLYLAENAFRHDDNRLFEIKLLPFGFAEPLPRNKSKLSRTCKQIWVWWTSIKHGLVGLFQSIQQRPDLWIGRNVRSLLYRKGLPRLYFTQAMWGCIYKWVAQPERYSYLKNVKGYCGTFYQESTNRTHLRSPFVNTLAMSELNILSHTCNGHATKELKSGCECQTRVMVMQTKYRGMYVIKNEKIQIVKCSITPPNCETLHFAVMQIAQFGTE